MPYSTQIWWCHEEAYENGIIVVIAGGNGDVLSCSSSWVNTTVNPISPVCNNGGNNKYSIGVESLDQNELELVGQITGTCIAFAAPGENIFSTSVWVFNKDAGTSDYETASGTSFSAAYDSIIIALGYNKI